MSKINKQDLIKVIKNGDDRLTNRLVIDKSGKIFLYEVETNQQADPILFNHNLAVINSEHFMPNQDFVGIDAAKDESFIDLEYQRMDNAWKKFLMSETLQYTSDHNY